jgi:hypothetical protein
VVATGPDVFLSAVGGGRGKGGVADGAGNVATDVSGKLEVDRVDGSGFRIRAEEELGDSDCLNVGSGVLGDCSGGEERGDGDELHGD